MGSDCFPEGLCWLISQAHNAWCPLPHPVSHWPRLWARAWGGCRRGCVGRRSCMLTRTLPFWGLLPRALGIQRQMWGQIPQSLAPLSQRCAGCSGGGVLGGGGPASQGRRWVPVCVPVSPRCAYKRQLLSRRAVSDNGGRFGCHRSLLPGWESGGVGRALSHCRSLPVCTLSLKPATLRACLGGLLVQPRRPCSATIR